MGAYYNFSEENATIPDVGVDAMLKDGRLERYKNGPIYWIDSADNNPCVGKQIHINIKMIHNDLHYINLHFVLQH